MKRTPRSTRRRARSSVVRSLRWSGRPGRRAPWWRPTPWPDRPLGRGRLHAVGQFIRAHARQQLGVGRVLGRAQRVQSLEQIERVALLARGTQLGAIEVQDRRRAGAERRALVHRGQEARAPVHRTSARLALAVVEHHVGRQVGVGRAERIRHPRAQRRPAGVQVAGVELQDRDVVRGAHGHARLDERQLVGVPARCWARGRRTRHRSRVLLPGPVRCIQLAHAPCVLVLMPFRNDAGTSVPASFTRSGLWS